MSLPTRTTRFRHLPGIRRNCGAVVKHETISGERAGTQANGRAGPVAASWPPPYRNNGSVRGSNRTAPSNWTRAGHSSKARWCPCQAEMVSVLGSSGSRSHTGPVKLSFDPTKQPQWRRGKDSIFLDIFRPACRPGCLERGNSRPARETFGVKQKTCCGEIA